MVRIVGVALVCGIVVVALALAPGPSARGQPPEGGVPPIAWCSDAPDLRVPVGAPGDRMLACYLGAEDALDLPDAEALRLCAGAVSRAPVACFERAASETHLLDAQLVELCRCARSTRPVSCAVRADRETSLNEAQIVDLCRATRAYGPYRDCRPAPYAVP